MARFSEYRKYTVELGEHVDKISNLLDINSINLNKLTQQLETLFNLFTRGDELIKIALDYSKQLREKINSMRRAYVQYEKAIGESNKRFLYFSSLLASINHLVQGIQTNASLFITSAQSLANLAKNAEISAHHAKKEGKGLAIIAKECLSLARRAQLPFRSLSILLRNLQQVADPVIVELNRIMELSSRSQRLLKKSFESLKTIDEITGSLKNIISRVDEHSRINRELKIAVSQGVNILKNQLVFSSTTFDNISIRCAQINSLSQILDTLDSTLSSITGSIVEKNEPSVQHQKSINEEYTKRQIRFFLNETIKTLKQLPRVKDLPLFPNLVAKNLTLITNQINEFNTSSNKLMNYEKELETGSTDVINVGTQIEDFFKETQNIYNRLNNVVKDLTDNLEKIKTLSSTASKVCTRIKTLSVFARIEEGRSTVYKNIVSPIVEEFVKLQVKTENALSDIMPQITQLAQDVQQLHKEEIVTVLQKIKHPDYAKIKIFLDDIVRVFREEQTETKNISKIVNKLYKNDELQKEAWHDYKGTLLRILTISSSFSKILEEQKSKSPAVIKSKNTIRISLPDDPLTLDPDRKTDVNSHRVICNFSAGMFQFGEWTEVIPGLCEDYSLSEDGAEYTFKIREGLKFQNGQLLKIEHIKDAFIKALQGPNFNFFEMIMGAKDFASTKDKTLLGIEIINNYTLKIKLEYPFSPILANLATNTADPFLAMELPIGMGPFKITSWEQGERIMLTANDYYFEGRPPVDELHFLIIKDEEEDYELFKKGTLSVYLPTSKSLKKIRTEEPALLYTLPELSVRYLCMNCQKEPFNNKRVRQAIAYAINKKGLVDTLLEGSAIAAEGIYPPSMRRPGHISRIYTFNPRKAKDLLRETGFKNGLPGIYSLDVSSTPSVIAEAEFVKSNLADIGVNVEINPMPWHSLLEKTFAGESILSFRGWVSDNGDPDNFMYPLFHSASHGRTGNTFFFSSPEVDQAIEDARKIRNLHQRNRLYQRIEEKILDESPGVFLFHRLQNIAVRKSILGLKPHPLGLIRAKYVCTFGHNDGRLHNNSSDRQKREDSHSDYLKSSRRL